MLDGLSAVSVLPASVYSEPSVNASGILGLC